MIRRLIALENSGGCPLSSRAKAALKRLGSGMTRRNFAKTVQKHITAVDNAMTPA
jgi:hypothetical protein